jgi:hypothetical protein
LQDISIACYGDTRPQRARDGSEIVRNPQMVRTANARGMTLSLARQKSRCPRQRIRILRHHKRRSNEFCEAIIGDRARRFFASIKSRSFFGICQKWAREFRDHYAREAEICPFAYFGEQRSALENNQDQSGQRGLPAMRVGVANRWKRFLSDLRRSFRRDCPPLCGLNRVAL